MWTEFIRMWSCHLLDRMRHSPVVAAKNHSNVLQTMPSRFNPCSVRILKELQQKKLSPRIKQWNCGYLLLLCQGSWSRPFSSWKISKKALQMIHEGVRKNAFESFHQGSIVPDEATQPHLAIEDFMQKNLRWIIKQTCWPRATKARFWL